MSERSQESNTPNDSQNLSGGEQIPYEELLEMSTSDSKLNKPPRRVSLTHCIVSCIAVCLAAVMLTYTICSSIYRVKLAGMQQNLIPGGDWSTGALSVDDSLELFSALFSMYSFYNPAIDEEAVREAALREFIRQTNDPYAVYYTSEQFAQMQQANQGETQGIGIIIVQDTLSYGGTNMTVIRIVSVVKGSPAQQAGLVGGDVIAYVGVGEARKSVHEMGYDPAIAALTGEKGTMADFTVLRQTDTDTYEEISFSVKRDAYTVQMVYSHVCTIPGYEDVGVVQINQFDIPTPNQFREAMDDLIRQGCKRFVFDIRFNPGGDLKSIEAVLSFFLQEGDVIIRTRDRTGVEEQSVVKEVTYTGQYADCSVSREDIGKYRNYPIAVLCNNSTASAAELFTAALRDYELATVVGTTTYGKGSMQSIFSLDALGCPGGIKMTTKMYFPPIGDGYDGKGVTPHVVQDLSEEATQKLLSYQLMDSEDEQLLKALESFS